MSNLCFEKYPIANLKPAQTVMKLTDKQQKYAYYLSLAAYAGAPIIFSQVNNNSKILLQFLTELCKKFIESEDLYNQLLNNKQVDQDNFRNLCEYTGQFFYQSGNYLGFGDTKFTLRTPFDEMIKLLELIDRDLIQLFQACQEEIYATSPNFIGFGEGAQTSYFPPSFTKEDAEEFNKILTKNAILPENNIVVEADGKYKIMHFCAEAREVAISDEFKGRKVVKSYGLFSSECSKIAEHLAQAVKFADTENQADMLQELIKYYLTGDMAFHLSYSKLWVQDANPAVETYQGFVETYRDPTGVRAEYEAFVACVDPDSSKQLGRLLEPVNCDEILRAIPMPTFLHRKTFNPPTYKAIDIIVFPTSGLPIGINIPNYDDIRNNFGFKNVSLQNVMASRSAKPEDIQYVPDHIKPLIIKYGEQILKAEVATHELFGHGSGSLIMENDISSIPASENITSFYKQNETFASVFGDLQSTFEECRAEISAFYLSFVPLIQEIFEFQKENLDEILLTATYEVFLAGISSLIQHKDSWLQAHSQARFAIIRFVLDKTDAIKIEASDDDIMLTIDSSRLDEIKNAYAEMTNLLNIMKASADITSARAFFDKFSAVDNKWIVIKNIAIKNRKPRKVFVSAMLKNNKICDYEGASMYGLECGLVNVQNMISAGVAK
ncbi:Dipeptidyl-peptidase III [Spironucleus salmonicida]|uniref:Dipeptidyl-peptidase III n=1 Tax=Spironucleus salmonicida TaxID=348837 RepID=V6LBX1_9EUKA|nr:Dipeptidyl-peptidase III [Spironucleus salmonicida]|eukprot:EST41995.1 Dipeptidyl-peptidase III [Spironucleus salmonicida]